MNRIPMSIVAGVVAGLVGAAVWGAVAYFLDMELGLLAWGIGGLVGFAVGATAQEDAGPSTGILAVVLSVLSIMGGKYAMVLALQSEYDITFADTFGVLDILFFIFAILTAYRLGAGDGD